MICNRFNRFLKNNHGGPHFQFVCDKCTQLKAAHMGTAANSLSTQKINFFYLILESSHKKIEMMYNPCCTPKPYLQLMQQSSKMSNNCAVSALAHPSSAAGHWVPACTSLSFCHGRVIGGRWRVIWEEGWCETEWETHACVLDGPQVTCSRASAKLWQDQTECLS